MSILNDKSLKIFTGHLLFDHFIGDGTGNNPSFVAAQFIEATKYITNNQFAIDVSNIFIDAIAISDAIKNQVNFFEMGGRSAFEIAQKVSDSIYYDSILGINKFLLLSGYTNGKTGGHAVSIYIERFNGTNRVVIVNSGQGVHFHDSIDDQNAHEICILIKSASDDQVRQLIHNHVIHTTLLNYHDHSHDINSFYAGIYDIFQNRFNDRIGEYLLDRDDDESEDDNENLSYTDAKTSELSLVIKTEYFNEYLNVPKQISGSCSFFSLYYFIYYYYIFNYPASDISARDLSFHDFSSSLKAAYLSQVIRRLTAGDISFNDHKVYLAAMAHYNNYPAFLTNDNIRKMYRDKYAAIVPAKSNVVNMFEKKLTELSRSNTTYYAGDNTTFLYTINKSDMYHKLADIRTQFYLLPTIYLKHLFDCYLTVKDDAYSVQILYFTAMNYCNHFYNNMASFEDIILEKPAKISKAFLFFFTRITSDNNIGSQSYQAFFSLIFSIVYEIYELVNPGWSMRLHSVPKMRPHKLARKPMFSHVNYIFTDQYYSSYLDRIEATAGLINGNTIGNIWYELLDEDSTVDKSNENSVLKVSFGYEAFADNITMTADIDYSIKRFLYSGKNCTSILFFIMNIASNTLFNNGNANFPILVNDEAKTNNKFYHSDINIPLNVYDPSDKISYLLLDTKNNLEILSMLQSSNKKIATFVKHYLKDTNTKRKINYKFDFTDAPQYYGVLELLETDRIDLINAYDGNWEDLLLPIISCNSYTRRVNKNSEMIVGIRENNSPIKYIVEKIDGLNMSYEKIASLRNDYALLILAIRIVKSNIYPMTDATFNIYHRIVRNRAQVTNAYKKYYELLLIILNGIKGTFDKWAFDKIFMDTNDLVASFLLSYLMLTIDQKLWRNYAAPNKNDSVKIISRAIGGHIEVLVSPCSDTKYDYCFQYGDITYGKFADCGAEIFNPHIDHKAYPDNKNFTDASAIMFRYQLNNVAIDSVAYCNIESGEMYLARQTRVYRIDRATKYKYVIRDGDYSIVHQNDSHIEPIKYFIEKLKKISTNVLLLKNDAHGAYKIYLEDLNIMFEYDLKFFYYGDYVLLFKNGTIDIFSRWVMGLENAFLLRSNVSAQYKILLLKLDKVNSLRVYNKYYKNNIWCAPLVKWDLDLNLEFQHGVYMIDINDYGTDINTQDAAAITAYCNSLMIFGNIDAFDMIYNKNKIVNGKFLEIMDYYQISHPFRHYFYEKIVDDYNLRDYKIRSILYPKKYEQEILWNEIDNRTYSNNIGSELFGKINELFRTKIVSGIAVCENVTDAQDKIRLLIKNDYSLASSRILSSINDAYIENLTSGKYTDTQLIIQCYGLFYDAIKMETCLKVLRELRLMDASNNYNCQMLTELRGAIDSNALYDGPRPTYIKFFEIMFQNIIRKDQYDLIQSISKNMNSYGPKSVYEILMGKGKTSVIAPILSFKCLYEQDVELKTKQVIIAMPKSLITQSNNSFIKYSKMLDKVKYQACKITRQDSKFKMCIAAKPPTDRLLITTGKSIQSYLLNGGNNLNDTFIIIDEIDSMINPNTSELNYPMGNKIVPEHISDIANIMIDLIRDNFETEIILDSDAAKNEFVSEMIMDYEPHERFTESWKYFVRTHIKKKVANIYLDKSAINIWKLIYDSFVDALGMLHRKDYGITNRSNKKGDIIAIPFIATNEPSYGSEFSDPYLTLVLTILSCKYSKLSEIQIVNLINNAYLPLFNNASITVQDKHKIFNSIFFRSKALYASIANFTWDKSTIASEDVENLSGDESFLRDYILTIVLPVIKVPRTQLNSSFYDVINSTFCKRRTGFSGTTNILLPLLGENEFTGVVKDSDAEQQIKLAIKYDIINGKVRENSIHISHEILSEIGNITGDCLIDTGAFLKNYATAAVAEIIHDGTGKAVVYFNEDDAMMIFNGRIHQPYADVRSTNANLFFYYDHKHTIGTDVRSLPLKMNGIVTINNFNRLTDVAQGIFRLRKINKGHNISFLITPSLSRIDNVHLLYAHLLKADAKYKQQTMFRSLLQNAKTINRMASETEQKYLESTFHSASGASYENFIRSTICYDENVACDRLEEFFARAASANANANARANVQMGVDQLQNEEEDEENEQEQEQELGNIHEITYAVSAESFYKIKDYFDGENYAHIFKFNSDPNLSAIVKYLSFSDIYASQYYLQKKVFQNNFKCSPWLNDGVVLNSDAYCLIITYQEYNVLLPFLSNSGITVYSKWSKPQEKQEYIINYVMGTLNKLEDILTAYRETNARDFGYYLTNVYQENHLPMYKLHNFIVDYNEDYVDKLYDSSSREIFNLLDIPYVSDYEVRTQIYDDFLVTLKDYA